MEVAVGGRSALVTAPDATTAEFKFLQYVVGVGRIEDRIVTHPQTVFRTCRVWAWRSAAGSCVFAPDFASAPPGSVRTDPFWAFVELPDVDLVRQVRGCWRSGSKMSWFHAGLKLRENNTIRPGLRGRLAMALRMAGLLPWVADPWEDRYPHRPNDRSHWGYGHRRRKLHSGSVPSEVIDRMLGEIGVDMVRFPPTARRAIGDFVRAYGYRPEDLRWNEIAALWTGGPEALERTRVDNRLGRHDFFKED